MLLDCASSGAALGSLSTAAGVAPHDMEAAVTSITWADLEGHDDPIRALPHVAAERLGRPLGRFSEVRYFHGTRTRDPDSFRRRGVLPLGTMLDDIWLELREIGASWLPVADFERLREQIAGGGGDGGSSYRLKTTGRMHHGPFAEYVREHFLRPNELGNHDYLRAPELVEDIAHAAYALFDIDLLAAYAAATVPCIVAFDMPLEDDADAVAATCWYLWAAAGLDLTRYACGGFDGRGVAVPPAAIRDVEIIDY